MAAKQQLEPTTFEAMLERLQRIADQLEQGSVPLDKALVLYEEGVGLAVKCAERLTGVEARVKELTKKADGLFEVRTIEENE